MKKHSNRRISELEDDIKERDRRIAELKDELERERDLAYQLGEHVKDADNMIDLWIQGFGMVLNDKGMWDWSTDADFIVGFKWFEKYKALLRDWNKFVPDYNALVRPRNVGRPLLASETQCVEVLKLHKAGKSLRGIVEETNLGLQTVRTVIGQRKRTDRTTVKYLSRIDSDRARMKTWMAKKQMRDRLPKQIYELRETGDKLLKEVKGLR